MNICVTVRIFECKQSEQCLDKVWIIQDQFLEGKIQKKRENSKLEFGLKFLNFNLSLFHMSHDSRAHRALRTAAYFRQLNQVRTLFE